MAEDRFVFGFWDGAKNREVDPLEVGAALEGCRPDYAGLIDVLWGGEKEGAAVPVGPMADGMAAEKRDAAEKLLAATRTAFGVRPFASDDGVRSGLTRRETFDLLASFMEFLAEAAKVARPFETSQPRDSPSTPPASTDEPSWDSGSVVVS